MPIQQFVAEDLSETRSEETVMGRKAEFTPMWHAAPHRTVPRLPVRRWGIILAGGDGARLRKLSRFICGDDRPKQFCPLVGSDTLLEQTRIRAERSVTSDRLLYSLTRDHRPFYLEELGIPTKQRIVQPGNKGTAPPIVHSLLSIEAIDENAIVAILPCDHHYSDEHAFTSALESAFKVAAERADSVVLLGASPQGPEVEYGWIELGIPDDSRTFPVQRFCEKPSFQVARDLLQRGALWNTFVMVGHVHAFLEMLRITLADIVGLFPERALWTGSEVHIPDAIYERMPAADFSRDVLSAQTRRLVALTMSHAGWSDLGHPERVMAALKSVGFAPWWMYKWESMRRSSSTAPLSQSATA